MSAKPHQSEHKSLAAPDVVSIRDFYGHDIRIALLEKTAADTHELLISMRAEFKADMAEIKTDVRELRNYIIGVYAMIGTAALGAVLAKIFGLI